MGLFNWGNKRKGAQTTIEAKSPKAAVATAKDPVCGMDVPVDKAAATSTYQGKTYYFCAAGCKKAFEQDPARYLGSATPKSEHEGHGKHGCCG